MHAVVARAPRWWPALVVAAALAATLPRDLGARGTKGCALDGASVMSFGNYDPMGNSPLDMQGRVSYVCYNEKSSADVAASADGSAPETTNGKIIVQISLTAGSAGNFNRYMSGSPDKLNYNLYLDPQRQTVWGDGSAGTHFYSEQAQPNNHIVVVPVYGRIFAAQDVGPGTYVDQLIVTLDF